MPRFLADLVLVAVTAVWGWTFVLVKEGISAFPVLPFLAARFGLAALALLPFAGHRLRGLDRPALAGGLAMGGWLFIGYLFQTLGLRSTPATVSAFITGLFVVFTPLLGALALGRRPGRAAGAGVVLATAGLAVLTLSEGLRPGVGEGLTFLCAVAFAAHILATDRASRRADPALLTLVQLTTVTALALALIPLASELPRQLPAATVKALAVTAFLATAAAFWAQTAMQRYTTPTHTALVFTMEPVFAALAARWLAGELLGLRAYLGGGLICLGMLVAELGDPHGGNA